MVCLGVSLRNALIAVVTDVLVPNVSVPEGFGLAHRLVSVPPEGMLQLRQGAPAVQPDPRLCVRDGCLSPGVLLPGGGQETRGTKTTIRLPVSLPLLWLFFFPMLGFMKKL